VSKSTDSPRIVDAVFGPHTKRHRWLHVMLPIACALAAHLIFVLIARSPSTSLEEWSEEVGRYVHEHVVVVTRVQYAPPPPEPAPPTTRSPRSTCCACAASFDCAGSTRASGTACWRFS
jgi:hypothetical protein